MQVILDTNFLMIPGKFKVDIFQLLKEEGFGNFIILGICIDELKKISRRKSTDAKNANLALELLDKQKITIIKTGNIDADKAILKHAVENESAVATNDLALIKALKKHRIKVIRLRQKKYLSVE